MDRKKLLGIILVLTSMSVIIILLLKLNIRYNKLVINNDKWNSIISSRSVSTSIKLENIEFNDYNLLVDNENSIIYYSVVNSSKKYNPSIKYVTNKKVSIAINDYITDDKLEQEDIKIMLYNDSEYRIYTLVVTNYPILNIMYDTKEDNKSNIPVQIELFDNHDYAPQRVIKSDGKFKVIEENSVYSLSLFKQSLGNNKRENHVSIFGMDKRDEYLIKKKDNESDEHRYIRLFINNNYSGIYSLGHKEGRINNFERNKEINK